MGLCSDCCRHSCGSDLPVMGRDIASLGGHIAHAFTFTAEGFSLTDRQFLFEADVCVADRSDRVWSGAAGSGTPLRGTKLPFGMAIENDRFCVAVVHGRFAWEF